LAEAEAERERQHLELELGNSDVALQLKLLGVHSTALPKLSSTFDHLRMLLTFAANASISSPAACHRG